jgi:hypothetical protein
MELNLEPLAAACGVTGKPFSEGDRVVSYLVRGPGLEIKRWDILAEQAEGFAPEGAVACRWVQVFKPRPKGENRDQTLKLTAETLFLALADPLTEPSAENTRLLQFLALMLERKRLLRPRALSADGARTVYEHAKTKQMIEVPIGELTPEFFIAVQQQLGTLLPGSRGAITAEPESSAPAETVSPAAP